MNEMITEVYFYNEFVDYGNKIHGRIYYHNGTQCLTPEWITNHNIPCLTEDEWFTETFKKRKDLKLFVFQGDFE